MNTCDKVILTDCDGVLLDWSYHFYKWLKENHNLDRISDSEYNVGLSLGLSANDGRKFVGQFNASGDMRFLSPHRDAIHYVRKLHEEHGYIFHVITSQTESMMARHWREENLKNVFGDVFDGFTILNCGEDKDDELVKWEGTECWWIEDKPTNVRTGEKFGLRGLLVGHEHNRDAFDLGHCRVESWKDIYNTITGDK